MKFHTIIVILLLSGLNCKAQSPLNGSFAIGNVSTSPFPPSEYTIEGDFSDANSVFYATDIKKDDIIGDFDGKLYRIDAITSLISGHLTVEVTYLSGAIDIYTQFPTSYSVGTLFRPTSEGYPLVTFDPVNPNPRLMASVQNAAMIAISKDIEIVNISSVTAGSDLNTEIERALASEATKEDTANKSKDVKVDGFSDAKFPSVKAVKTYVDAADTTAATNLGNEAARATTAEATKEDKANKSLDVAIDGTSDTKFPSVKAIKTYVDAHVTSDASTTNKGIVQLAGELAGSAAAPTLLNDAVTGKKLNGLNSTGGTIDSNDSILSAIGKLNGNIAGLAVSGPSTSVNLTGDVTSIGNATTLNNNAVTGQKLDNYASAPGLIDDKDSILSAIEKLNGNIGQLDGGGTVTNLFFTSDASSATIGALGESNAIIPLVTPPTGTNKAGLMSPLDKAKLDGISATVTGANLSGDVSSLGSVTTITNGSISNLKLATDAVSTIKLVNGSVSLAKMGNVGSGTVFYRKTTGTGVPEVQSLATLKTDLGIPATLSGSNTGDDAINTNYKNDYNPTNFIAGSNYLSPTGSAAGLTNFPRLDQDTNGTSANVTGIVQGANGGTGIDNRGKTITLGGNLSTEGAFSTTLTTTANTILTLPISGTLATQGQLDLKEDVTNKSISANFGLDATSPNSDSKYPTVLAVKTYVDAQTASTGVADGAITTIKLADASVTLSKLSNVPSGTVFYRKTAGIGVPEIQNLATLKTDLGIPAILSGSNTGDQTLASLGAVAKNPAITGATNTKITYDAKGLVVSGTSLSASDIPLLNQNTTGTAGNIAGAGIVSGANGGTGVNNSGKTISLSANLATTGGSNITFDAPQAVTITLPNVDAILATKNDLLDKEDLSNKSTNANFTVDANSPNSDNKYPSVLAVKTYMDGLLATGAVADGSITNAKLDSDAVSTTKLASGSVTLSKLSNVASGTIFYRKTAGAGVPEVQNLATLKTDLGIPAILSGSNTGDQTLASLGAVAKNPAITGATNTKITYDAKGLVVSGTSLSVTDIPLLNQNSTGTAGNIAGAGIVAGTNGGTGVSNSGKTISLSANLATTGGSNITFDAPQAVTITLPDVDAVLATKNDLFDKEDLSNKSLNANFAFDATSPNSDSKYPTVLAVKTYVDGLLATGAVADGSITNDKLASDAVSTTKLASGSVTLSKLSNVPSGTIFYRKTAGSGVPEIQNLATLKTDLGIPTILSGSNTGDQTLASLGAVAKNPAITGATNTKITYDVKGLVVSGTSLSVTDIPLLNQNTTGTAGNIFGPGIVSAANGGTGINNSGKTISLGGDLVTSGPYATTLNATGPTTLTLPVSGTLATKNDLLDKEDLSNKTTNANFLADAASPTSDSKYPSVLAVKSYVDAQTASAEVTAGLSLKENLSNKSTSITFPTDGLSDEKYTTVAAVRNYVDGLLATGGVADESITNVKLATDAVSTTKLVNASVTLSKLGNVASGSVFYRKTAGIGTPEVQSLATLKTDLGILGTVSGSNTGDQTLASLGAVAKNSAIIGATNTKITYDAKGLVVSGTSLSASDIPILNQDTSGSALNVTGIVAGANGGTGINNSGKTISLSANLATTGGSNIIFNAPEAVTITLPDVDATLATKNDLIDKENLSNKSINANFTADAGSPASDSKYPSVLAVKTYVDGLLAAGAVADGSITNTKLASDAVSTTKLANGSVTLSKLSNVPSGTVFYRKTAGTGVPELQTLATLKTDLGIPAILSGSNTGDQTLASLGAVAGNALITGATNTKITYDSKGLVVSGTSLSVTDIPLLNQNTSGTAGNIAGAGIVSAANGGTGVNNSGKTISLSANLATTGGSNITFDAPQAVTITLPDIDAVLATKNDLIDKENLSNKSINANFTADAVSPTSDSKYPSVLAVKTYVDGLLATGAVADGSITNAKLASDAVSTTKLANGSVTLSKLSNVPSGTVFYRKTAGTGLPEVQTLAALKTDLGIPAILSGINTGDQTLASLGAVEGNALITAATNTKITYDAKGLVVSGTSLSASDIPTLNQNTTGTAGNIAGSGIVSSTNGGTGINNSGKTLTLGGDLITSGAYVTTLTTTGPTTLTLPVSGTLATLTDLAAGAPDATTTNKGIVKLAGDLSGTAVLPTITNAAVIGKVLTGFTSGAGTIAPTDNILQAIQKLDGNLAAGVNDASTTSKGKIQLAGDLAGTAAAPTITNAAVIGKVLTGFTSGAGTIAPTDNILQAIQKLDGNVTAATPDATSLIKGKIQLAGDLGGTAAVPTITNAAVIGKVLTGFTSAAGTIAPTDNILQAIQKLDGNLAAGVIDASTTTKGKIQLAGDLAGTALVPTITNAAVIGKVLTGFTSGAGTIAPTDNILQAIQKLDGNLAAGVIDASTSTKGKIQLAGDLAGTASAPQVKDAAVLGRPLTGFTSGAGTIAPTDNILQAIQKLDGNLAAGVIDATTTTKGKIQLAGDLAGTASAPQIKDAAVIGKVLTGFTSGAGTIAPTDNILQAIQKLDGNVASKQGAITLSITGTTGAATLSGGVLNIPQYSNGTATNVTGLIAGVNGGTGVANTGKTITLGGNLTTSGPYNTTLAATAATAVTLPTTGTLATVDGVETLTNKTLTGSAAGTSTLAGFNSVVNTVAGTVYTLVQADNGKVINFTSGSAIALTIPAGLVAGFNCLIVQYGAGAITLTASGTTVVNKYNYTKTAGQYSIATIVSPVPNVFIASGNMN